MLNMGKKYRAKCETNEGPEDTKSPRKQTGRRARGSGSFEQKTCPPRTTRRTMWLRTCDPHPLATAFECRVDRDPRRPTKDPQWPTHWEPVAEALWVTWQVGNMLIYAPGSARREIAGTWDDGSTVA